jgi:transposase
LLLRSKTCDAIMGYHRGRPGSDEGVQGRARSRCRPPRRGASIAPERLLRALLLQAFYSIRSERQLMEQLHYNLLYRWFVGLGVDDRVWVPTVFTKNRDRLLEAEVARKFLAELLAHRQVRALLSDDHFSVDGTQVQAWASMKSFVAKDGSGDPPSPGRNGERHFHGEQRSNETHSSTTDPEAKLAKKGKGKEAKLAYTGHVIMPTASSSRRNCVKCRVWSSAKPRKT